MQSMFLFSGFGAVNGSLLNLLRAFHARPTHRPLLLTAADAVEQALQHVGPDVATAHLPRGLPLRRWLAGEEPFSPQDLEHSVVEGLLTHLYQLCLLQPDPLAPAPRGADRDAAVGIGHSLGVVSAAMAGLRIRNQVEFSRQAHDFVLFVMLGLLRCHQVAGIQRPDPVAARGYAEQAGPGERPSPMAAVVGIDPDEVRSLLHSFNLSAERPVEVGLVNGPRSLVLTGGVDPLLALWSRHQDRWQRDGVRWTFVRTTAPFHSSVLAPALELVGADRAALGRGMSGHRLAFPIWSMDGSHNLQASADIFDDCMEQVFCRPVDWSSAVRAAVRETDPQQVLDYGPGVAVRVFTKESLRSLGLRPRFAPVTAPR